MLEDLTMIKGESLSLSYTNNDISNLSIFECYFEIPNVLIVNLQLNNTQDTFRVILSSNDTSSLETGVHIAQYAITDNIGQKHIEKQRILVRE